MDGKYDQFILAGAALGAETDKFPAWGTTFWEHVQVAIDLHGIKKIIVMDHRDCGAYKAILGLDLAANPTQEFDAHAAQMRSLRADIGRGSECQCQAAADRGGNGPGDLRQVVNLSPPEGAGTIISPQVKETPDPVLVAEDERSHIDHSEPGLHLTPHQAVPQIPHVTEPPNVSR